MKWSKAIPEESGFYWHKYDDEKISIVEVDRWSKSQVDVWIIGDDRRVNALDDDPGYFGNKIERIKEKGEIK